MKFSKMYHSVLKKQKNKKVIILIGFFLFLFLGVISCGSQVKFFSNSSKASIGRKGVLKRQLIFRADWPEYGNNSDEVASDIEYSVESLKKYAEDNGILISEDEKIPCTYILEIGNRKKMIKGGRTNVELWDLCNAYFGINEKRK